MVEFCHKYPYNEKCIIRRFDYVMIFIVLLLFIVLALFIDVICFIEILVNLKLFQKEGINFLINYGSILKTKEIEQIVGLLEPRNRKNKRIIIYKYRWQFMPFYLLRMICYTISKNYAMRDKFKPIINKDINKDVTYGCYYDFGNFIEIFEFNIKNLSTKYKYDEVEILMIQTLIHELRHREQRLSKLNIKEGIEEELDADNYAIEFCNNNKEKISQILGMDETYTLTRKVKRQL